MLEKKRERERGRRGGKERRDGKGERGKPRKRRVVNMQQLGSNNRELNGVIDRK